MTIAKETADLLSKLGVTGSALTGGDLSVASPVTGEQIAALKTISADVAGKTIEAAHEASRRGGCRGARCGKWCNCGKTARQRRIGGGVTRRKSDEAGNKDLI